MHVIFNYTFVLVYTITVVAFLQLLSRYEQVMHARLWFYKECMNRSCAHWASSNHDNCKCMICTGPAGYNDVTFHGLFLRPVPAAHRRVSAGNWLANIYMYFPHLITYWPTRATITQEELQCCTYLQTSQRWRRELPWTFSSSGDCHATESTWFNQVSVQCLESSDSNLYW